LLIVRHIAEVPESLKGAVIAIGNFDGVHRGHQALIETAAALAKARDVPLAVMVFEPPPQDFFNPGGEPYRLTPFRVKAKLIANLGADALFAFPFDADLAHLPAPDFVLKVLVEGLKAACVVVGEDFQFGAGKGGDATSLAYMGEMEGFVTAIVPPVMNGDEKISSTTIRQLVRQGRPETAADLLGRPYSIEGRVMRGDARGRTLGFPTANLSLTGYLRPAFGIYAVRATLFQDDKPVSCHTGVANLGIRPTFRIETPLLETFLFDFNRDIYDHHMAVALVSFLRPEEKFHNVSALVAQMTLDKDVAKAALERSPHRW
jgi:riboflavin kinase / FMN adenylyltransferase